MSKVDQDDSDDLRPEYTEAELTEGVRGKYAPRIPVQRLTLALECGEQADGRWLARIVDLPGLSAHDESREKAIDRVEALAVATIDARVERGEMPPTGLNFAISFHERS
jgi:predicted RNase H-like HicB family nuclease